MCIITRFHLPGHKTRAGARRLLWIWNGYHRAGEDLGDGNPPKATPIEQWKKPWWIGDEILPNYVGIVINHEIRWNKDPS